MVLFFNKRLHSEEWTQFKLKNSSLSSKNMYIARQWLCGGYVEFFIMATRKFVLIFMQILSYPLELRKLTKMLEWPAQVAEKISLENVKRCMCHISSW